MTRDQLSDLLVQKLRETEANAFIILHNTESTITEVYPYWEIDKAQAEDLDITMTSMLIEFADQQPRGSIGLVMYREDNIEHVYIKE